MNLAEMNALPETGAQHPAHDRLMAAARSYREIAGRAYAGFSGADRAEAPKHDLTADALGAIALGKDVEATIAWARAKWVAYCADNNARIDAAPKVKRGPYKGQSSIHYRWTSAESFDSIAIFLRTMAKQEPQ